MAETRTGLSCCPYCVISYHASSGKSHHLLKAVWHRWLGLLHKVGVGIKGCGVWKARSSESGPWGFFLFVSCSIRLSPALWWHFPVATETAWILKPRHNPRGFSCSCSCERGWRSFCSENTALSLVCSFPVVGTSLPNGQVGFGVCHRPAPVRMGKVCGIVEHTPQKLQVNRLFIQIMCFFFKKQKKARGRGRRVGRANKWDLFIF